MLFNDYMSEEFCRYFRRHVSLFVEKMKTNYTFRIYQHSIFFIHVKALTTKILRNVFYRRRFLMNFLRKKSMGFFWITASVKFEKKTIVSTTLTFPNVKKKVLRSKPRINFPENTLYLEVQWLRT